MKQSEKNTGLKKYAEMQVLLLILGNEKLKKAAKDSFKRLVIDTARDWVRKQLDYYCHSCYFQKGLAL